MESFFNQLIEVLLIGVLMVVSLSTFHYMLINLKDYENMILPSEPRLGGGKEEKMHRRKGGNSRSSVNGEETSQRRKEERI